MHFGSLPVTLRQLQYVLAVAETRGFGSAARLCHVSQPSLSAQVAEVERALGARLFERGRGGVKITPAGEAVVARALQVVVGVEDLVDAVERTRDPFEGRMRFGVIPTMAAYLLPIVDPALRRAFPRLDLVWLEDKTEVLVRRADEGELDGAFLALEADLGDLEHDVLGVDPFVLAAPQDHALGQETSRISMRALTGEPVLLLDEGHCFRDQALALCSTHGVVERGFRATSLSTLTQMVVGGAGITLLPELSLPLENRQDDLAIRRFVAPEPGRTLALAWRPGSAMKDALREVARVAREAYEASRVRASSSRSTSP